MTLHYQFIDGDRTLAPLLLLHGNGGTERDLLPIGQFIAPDAPRLAIRGREIEQGETRYFRHLPDGTIDFANLDTETTWLLNTAAALTRKYQLFASRMIVAGYSNGGNLAIRAMMSQPLPYRTALLFHGKPLGPLDQPKLRPQTLVWASYGTHDPIVSQAEFATLQAQIQTAGGELTTFTHDELHNLNLSELQGAKSWLAQSGRLKEESL